MAGRIFKDQSEKDRYEQMILDSYLPPAKEEEELVGSEDPFSKPDQVRPNLQDAASPVAPASAPMASPEFNLPIAKAAPSTKIPSAALPSREAAEAKIAEKRNENAQLPTVELETNLKGDLAKAKAESEGKRDPIAKDLDWLEKQYSSLNKEYKDQKDTNEWRAVAETVSNALTKLFAARAGMKAGVDMSGLQLNKTDFNAELASVKQDIERRQGQAKTLYDESQRGISLQRDEAAKKAAEDFEKEKFAYTKLIDKEKLNAAKVEAEARREEARTQKEVARADREERELAKKEENLMKLSTPFGLAKTAEDAKKLKDANEVKQSFDSKINELIDLRKEYGGEAFNREAVARGRQLSKDLLLAYKDMAKLGVLSISDEKILNAIIPDDPLAFQAATIVGQDPILTKLTKFKQDSDKDFVTRIQTRTRDGVAPKQDQASLPPRDQEALDWANANPKDPRAAKIKEKLGK